MKVAYVNPAEAHHASGEAVLAAWWSTPALLEAVADRRGAPASIEVFFRCAQPFSSITRNSVTYHFAVDRGRFGWRTALRVRRGRPDVVHINGFTHPWRSVVLMLVTRRSAHVVQHHGEAPSASRRALIAQRWIGRRAAAIAMTGAHHGNAAAFVAAGVITRRDRLHEVTETVIHFEHAESETVLDDTPGLSGRPCVLWVGRHIADKDVATALAALSQLRRTHPDATLTIVGPGHESLTAADVTGVTGVTGVTVVGERPRNELPAWYRTADVLLSTSHREGSGYAVLEALACGTRVAVTDLPSHRAIVPNPLVRFVPGDAQGAAQALRSALAETTPAVPDAAAQLLSCYGAAHKVTG